MAIELPPLPYSLDALAPQISQKTLEFHYGKHHKAYVDTLNTLIAGSPLANSDLHEIMNASHGKQPKIFNNAAQVWNHTFYWNGMTPAAKAKKEPSAAFKGMLEKKFGSFSDFQAKFVDAGKGQFGSGWAWLVKDKSGSLSVRATPNAENPLLDGEVPLLVCDVWEHAYYLDYQNARPKYLETFWSIVNWDFVEKAAEISPERAREGFKALLGGKS